MYIIENVSVIYFAIYLQNKGNILPMPLSSSLSPVVPPLLLPNLWCPRHTSAVPPSTCSSSLKELHNSLQLPNNSWSDQSTLPLIAIKLCKISCSESLSSQPLLITHSLTVYSTLHWSLFVHNHEVNSSSCTALAIVPSTLTLKSFLSLLNMTDCLHVCTGHPDDHFISMISAKKGMCSGAPATVLDSSAPKFLNGCHFTETVGTSACELLVNNVKCSSCKMYSATLIYNRQSSRK